MRRISLRQIEAFLLASEYLSFVRGAEAMNVTPSAFSQMIRDLEVGLEVRLFDRTTRRICLTAAGGIMLHRMKHGLQAINDACDEARAIARLELGNIRIGTLASLSVGIVTRTLGQFRQRYPGITISMREGVNADLIDYAASGETDLSVCSQSKPDAGLSFQPLFDDELLVVIRSNHVLASKKHISWSDLAEEPMVLNMRNTGTREHVGAALIANGIVRPAEIEAESMITALAMVRAGLGLTFISRAAWIDLPRDGLISIRMQRPAVRRMGIYTRTDRVSSPATKRFVELLKTQADKTIGRLESR